MLLDLIESSKKTKTLLGFHYYGSEDGFYCGYVVDYTDAVIDHHAPALPGAGVQGTSIRRVADDHV